MILSSLERLLVLLNGLLKLVIILFDFSSDLDLALNCLNDFLDQHDTRNRRILVLDPCLVILNALPFAGPRTVLPTQLVLLLVARLLALSVDLVLWGEHPVRSSGSSWS